MNQPIRSEAAETTMRAHGNNIGSTSNNGFNNNYGGGGFGRRGMGYGGMGMHGMYGMGGMMGGMMEKMSSISMAIGMLGHGIQMIGMNAELIQNAFTGLVQLLAESTATMNELSGCPSDRSIGPLSYFKTDPFSGKLIPKSQEELKSEKEIASKRRQTSRWIICLLLCIFVYKRIYGPKQSVAAIHSPSSSNLVDEFRLLKGKPPS